MLYGLAISQSAKSPDEGVHTKQIGLARALRERGPSCAIAALLQAARLTATKQDDASALAEIDALQCAWTLAN